MGCSFPQGGATTITRMLQIRHILASLLALGAVLIVSATLHGADDPASRSENEREVVPTPTAISITSSLVSISAEQFV